MFGLMTKAEHERLMAGMKAEIKRWVDELNEAYREAREMRDKVSSLTKYFSDADRKAHELDALASKFQTRAKRLELDNAALVAEIDRLRPIAEKAEARKAHALANLKQNRTKQEAA
ncbi:MAG: hypothetical protein ACK4ZW_08355 [Blastomonas sp.]